MKPLGKGTQAPVLFEYLKRYQEDPNSRVFAPLAEAYRKAGLLDEAIEIAREGLNKHPQFIGGRVALARALFDKKLYIEVIDELRSVVRDAPDNLIAQRLFAESQLLTGNIDEALNSYKMLLFLVPSDAETAAVVKELESQGYSQGKVLLKTAPAGSSRRLPPLGSGEKVEESSFELKPVSQVLRDEPERVRQQRNLRIERLQDMLKKVERYRILQG